jgi:hypothetical protein
MIRLHAFFIAAALLFARGQTALPFPDLLAVAPFELDVTPPLGSPLCDGYVPPAKEIVDRLWAKGVVLITDEKPIVLVALDWVGIGNAGHQAFREALADATGTTPQRVAVHCLHQHDAPGCDFASEALLAAQGFGGRQFDPLFARETIQRLGHAAAQAMKAPRRVTHIGIGKGKVEQVASNRRVMGPDGKVKSVRWSATKDAAVRAEPEGIIDPFVRMLAFFDGQQPVASLSYYATHPQSYYAQGGVSCDFPGLARALFDKEHPGVHRVHFNGAGGNVTAGKYNDGSPENRPVLARRLASGMQSAWRGLSMHALRAGDLKWNVVAVDLPPAAFLEPEALKMVLANERATPRERIEAARRLSWFERRRAHLAIEIASLTLGPACVLHMPGELFVEYQLAAQSARPNLFVMMAAYGDYGPGYIGLARHYAEGGYETGPVSLVAPEAEELLMSAINTLLK